MIGRAAQPPAIFVVRAVGAVARTMKRRVRRKGARIVEGRKPTSLRGLDRGDRFLQQSFGCGIGFFNSKR